MSKRGGSAPSPARAAPDGLTRQAKSNSEMTTMFTKTLLAGALALGVAVPAAAGPDALGCFTRTYDSAHLAQHPDQLITAVKLRIYMPPPDPEYAPSSANVYWFTAKFRLRGRSKTMHAGGVCRGEASDLHCVVECDGGGVDLVIRNDRATMRLDRIRVVECGEVDDETNGEDLTGGKDDRVFRLDRVEPAVCNEGRMRADGRGD